MMKRKVAAVAVASALALCLTGCGEKEAAEGSSGGNGSVGQQEPAPAPEPLDLMGTWREATGGDNVQEAVISNGMIEVYWVSPDSRSLYWAGSYEAPTSPDDKHSWESVNDKSKTGSALLASSADSKQFSYEKGVLSYEVTAMGSTVNVELEKVSDEAVIEAAEPDFSVTINSAVKTTDKYDGSDAVAISFTWVNNSDEACSFDLSISSKAFQDGVQLETAFVNDDEYDTMAKSLDIQPGTTQEVWAAYKLTSDSDVSVEVSDMWGNVPFDEKTFPVK